MKKNACLGVVEDAVHVSGKDVEGDVEVARVQSPLQGGQVHGRLPGRWGWRGMWVRGECGVGCGSEGHDCTDVGGWVGQRVW